MQTQAIVIGEATIQQDAHGRYSLNDLHRAAGGEQRHRPVEFMRLQGTQDLVAEIQSGDSHSAPVEVVNGGPERGTYVCRELVYAYAMWVSPAFHLKVIRVFDALASGRVAVAAPAVLPSPQEAAVGAHFAVLRHLSSVPGVRAGIAASMVLDAIHADTGLTMEPYRKALPAMEGAAASLNATALGKALGLSAPKANALLASKGLQKRNARGEWELTEAGQKVAEAIPYTRGSHSGYQILWRPEVVGSLKQ